MPSFNSVHLVGHVTRDPEVTFTPSGKTVANFSLAMNYSYTTEGGDKREEVTFVDCQAWQKTAELLGQYVKKGDPLLVDGRLKQESWEDKNTGAKRSKLLVVVNGIQFLKSKGDDSGHQESRTTQRQQSTGRNYGPTSDEDPFA